MGGALVSDAELCWVLQAHEPAQTSTVAAALPVEKISTYVRLRSLARRGYVSSTDSIARQGTSHRWSLMERGRALVADADLPSAAETDFQNYFSDRTNTLDHETLLRELAAHEEIWVTSSALYDPLPYSKVAIRNNLHELREKGLVALDRGETGKPHHWRLTDAGREQLSPVGESSEKVSTECC